MPVDTPNIFEAPLLWEDPVVRMSGQVNTINDNADNKDTATRLLKNT